MIGTTLTPGVHTLEITNSASSTDAGSASAIYTFTVPNCGEASCDCSQATLEGDTVTALDNVSLGSTPQSKTVVVGAGPPEFQGAGFGLLPSPPNPPGWPIWDINFDANTIQIDWRAAQGVSAGVGFTFGSLDPKAVGACLGTRKIVGATVTSNNASYNPVGAATVTGNAVSVRYGNGTGGSIQWNPGQFLKITLQFDCGPDPCCPPWNKNTLSDMMQYQATGNVNAPYALIFQPTSSFNTSMQAYIDYLATLGLGIKKITIHWAIHDQGPMTANPTGYVSYPNLGLNNCPNPLGPNVVAADGSGSTVYYSNWVSPTGGNMGPNILSQLQLQKGHWYVVHTWINLTDNVNDQITIPYYPDSCYNACMLVGWSSNKATPEIAVSGAGKKVTLRPVKPLKPKTK